MADKSGSRRARFSSHKSKCTSEMAQEKANRRKPSHGELPTTWQECWETLKKVRTRSPLVHCITNYVSMEIMANTLLSVGASPAMVHAEEEVEEFVALASALSINIGTLSTPWVASMQKAAAKAHQLAKPWVLDPVGCGATSLRTRTCRDLVLSHGPTVIRGNAAEIMALSNCITLGLNSFPGGQRGVDSTRNADDAITHAKVLAKECDCVVVVTGKSDYVTDGTCVISVSNGHPVLPKITATGCSLSSIMAAFVAVVDSTNQEQVMKACAHALCVFGIAGQLAADRSMVHGIVCPGSTRAHLVDALTYMKSENIQKLAMFN